MELFLSTCQATRDFSFHPFFRVLLGVLIADAMPSVFGQILKKSRATVSGGKRQQRVVFFIFWIGRHPAL